MPSTRISTDDHLYIRRDSKIYVLISILVTIPLAYACWEYFQNIMDFSERMRLLLTVLLLSAVAIVLSYIVGTYNANRSLRYIVQHPELSEVMIKKPISYDTERDRLSGENFVFDFTESKLYISGRSDHHKGRRVTQFSGTSLPLSARALISVAMFMGRMAEPWQKTPVACS